MPSIIDRIFAGIAAKDSPQAKDNNGVQPPGFWQAFANPNVNSEYYQGLNQRALESLMQHGQQTLAGQEAQQTAARDQALSLISKDKDFRASTLSMAEKAGVPIANDNDLADFASNLYHPAMLNTMAQQALAKTQLGTEQNAANSPRGKEATSAGFLASQEMPFADLLAKIPKFSLGEGADVTYPGIGNYTYNPTVPQGSSTSSTSGYKVNGDNSYTQLQTGATRDLYKTGGGGFNPQIDDTDADREEFQKQQENNIQNPPPAQAEPDPLSPQFNVVPYQAPSPGPIPGGGGYALPPNSQPVLQMPQGYSNLSQEIQRQIMPTPAPQYAPMPYTGQQMPQMPQVDPNVLQEIQQFLQNANAMRGQQQQQQPQPKMISY